ncbi:MAG: alanine racemase [Deltaproteobacteria bacterium]|nr:alanine racemase [Deltaproteobacteria bacterium]
MEPMATHGRDANTWIELETAAIENNVRVFRELIGEERILTAVVKSDAYGHGLLPVAEVSLRAGANWLGVFDAGEGFVLREQGVNAPIIVLGSIRAEQIERALAHGFRLTVASVEAARLLAGKSNGSGAVVHLKLETGTNRQGLDIEQLPATVDLLREAGIEIEGVYTHYADIEDTTDHTFAEQQRGRFERCLARLGELGVDPPLPHTACTAAAILFEKTYFAMVRVGIGLYGLWPSRETLVSANALGRNRLGLRPVMTWKTRVVQVKTVSSGQYVGYGRTYRSTRETRVAVLPVGYADGYDRRLSGVAHVLVSGVRAPVLGRVCMNMIMVDATDVPGVIAGDEVVLLGQQGDETISAEDLAGLAGTINYEIVTRAAPGAPRFLV